MNVIAAPLNSRLSLLTTVSCISDQTVYYDVYHIPHNKSYHLHDNFVQSLKESFQRSSLVTHPAKNNPKHDREHH